MLGRLIAQKMTEHLGQPVIVDNRPGSSGRMGIAEVARASVDGYTILIGTNSTDAINPGLYSKLTYDPINDFAPVSLMATNRFVMTVPASLPVTTVGELINLAKANPGKYDYASTGNGTTSNLSAVLLVFMPGAPPSHIPYKSNAPALVDLLAGRVSVMFDNITAIQTHIQSGALRPIATTGLTRSPILKDIPTLSVSGVKGSGIIGWFCILAPAATSPDVVNRLTRELVRIIALSEVREKISSIGAEPETSTPAALKRLITTELPKWKNLIQMTGAKID